MINLHRTLLEFFGEFGVPVFLEGNVVKFTEQGSPIAPKMPYITFNFARADIFGDDFINARIWTRDISYMPILEIFDRIEKAVPSTGILIDVGNNEGAIMLKRGSPFFQYLPSDPDDQLIKTGRVLIHSRSYVI